MHTSWIFHKVVKTHLRRGGICNNYVIVNCLQSVTVKEFWKSINNWRKYGQVKWHVFWPTMYMMNYNCCWPFGITAKAAREWQILRWQDEVITKQFIQAIQWKFFFKSASSWVYIFRKAETKLEFSDKQLQISDRRGMDAQNFNFATKSPQMGISSHQYYGFFSPTG